MTVPTRIQQAEHRDAAAGARILLYQQAETYVAYRRDAEELGRAINVEPEYYAPGVAAVFFPSHDLPRVLRRCIAAGLRVAVLEPVTAE